MTALDQDAARLALLQAILGGRDGGQVALRTLRDGAAGPQPTFAEPDDASGRAAELAESWDVYVGTLPRFADEAGRVSLKKASCRGGSLAWADCDTDESLDALAIFPVRPTFVIESGGRTSTGRPKLHAWWALDRWLDVPETEALVTAMAHRLGSDPAVKDASRILRLPGTVNYKAGGRPVVCVEANGAVSLDRLRLEVGEAPGEVHEAPAESLNGPSPALDRPAPRGDCGPPPDGADSGRNNWLACRAGHLAREAATWGECEESIRSLNRSSLDVPLDDGELEATVLKSARRWWETSDAGKADDRERKIAKQVEWLEVQREARERVAAEAFTEPEDAGTFAEALARPVPPETWTIEGLAEVGHNVLLAAEYKAGKTTLVLNLIRALVDGDPFLGRFATRLGGTVAYLNYELTDLDARGWIADQGVERPDRALLINLRGRPNPLATPAGREWLVAFLQQGGAEFMVVDTFRASYSGDSHNDNAQVARYTRMLDEVKQQAGIAGLLLSHHFGRKEHEPGKEHGQGAVELDNWADSRWTLTKDRVGTRFLRVEGRSRGGLEESRLRFDPSTRRLALGEGEVGLDRRQSLEEEVRGEVLRAIQTTPGANSREVQEAVHRRKDEVAKALRELRASGRVVVVDGPNRSKLHYRPSDAPGTGIAAGQAELGVDP